MIDYFLIRPHPNGGYAAVECEEGVKAPSATTKNRKFRTPDDAYLWANMLHSKYGVMYSPEVKAIKRKAREAS